MTKIIHQPCTKWVVLGLLALAWIVLAIFSHISLANAQSLDPKAQYRQTIGNNIVLKGPYGDLPNGARMNLLTAGRGYWFQATIKQPTDEDVVVRSGFHVRMEDGRLHRMAYDSIQTAGTRHWIRFNSGEVWGKIPGRTDDMVITFHDADGQLMDEFELSLIHI